MPLYEYKCNSCEKVFEVMQRFSDEPLTVHEGCGGTVERLLSAPALQFKGSGWYITDYAGGKSGAKPSGSNGDAGSETKSSDAKPADSGSAGGSSSSTSTSSTSSTDKK